MSFAHLHVHSQYSLSSSLVRLEDLVTEVDKMGMNALALTDWGNLYGALHFYKECKGRAEGRVKPIFGAELGVIVDGGGGFPRHLVLLAETFEGWKNLSALVTASHVRYGLDGEVLRPQIPLQDILDRKEGLIALTAGLKGVLNGFLVQDQEALARATLQQLKAGFGEKNLFLELQDSSLSLQKHCNSWLLDQARAEGLGVVATADVHYMKQEDAFAQEVWMMVAQKLNLEQNPSSRLSPREYYLRTPEEMRDAFSFIPEALSNTVAIAERCNVKLSFKDKAGKRIYHLPTFNDVAVPGAEAPAVAVETEDAIFARLTKEGLEVRLAKIRSKRELTEEQAKPYWERMAYEVDTIQKMGFSGYYLIVSDFIRWAKSHDIPVGPGRGSGAGSLAAWALDITDLDPIEHGLLFERFLNPERVSLPDFDVDFCQERRFEVIQYVAAKYGKERVCQIVTFAKEQSKNALKDVGRVLGLSFGETNRITKLIPSVMAKPLTLAETLEEVDEFKDLVKADPKIRQTTELALKIEGALRQPGVHAAGVIIASQAVDQLAPLSVDLEGNLITQWDMKYSEEAGLVKFDFLGLVTLDLMQLACRWINKRTEPDDGKVEVPAKDLKYDNIPIHDPRAYEIIAAGRTMGVFQLESSGMQNLCVRMKPDRFGDITAINALFRPGPLQSGMVDDFINRKHGRAKIEVMFPEMEPSLRETYGVIIYQEQVMEMARVVAGYSLGGADLLRRAMGKKNPAEMEKQRQIFVDGSVKLGKPAAKAGELFDLIEKFAGYGFNKSHAAAYALLAVQTAYLKAVYPTEFFTALLTIEKQDTEKLSRYIADAKQMGLEILPPDVNESDLDFAIVGPKTIRFGMSAIKNVGESAVEAVLEARKASGPFRDLYDFAARVDSKRLNKRMVEALIQAGAFDSLAAGTADAHSQAGAAATGAAQGLNDSEKARLRGRYLLNCEKALEWASKVALQKELGQFSLFGGGGSDGDDSKDETAPPYEVPREIPNQKQLLDWEKELLGIYLSGSPLDKYLDRAKAAGCVGLFDLKDRAPKSQVAVAAWIAELREVRVKKGRRAGELMAILKLEDTSGQVEMVSFPDHFKENAELFRSGKPLLIRAELDFEDDKPKLIGGNAPKGGGGGLAVEDLDTIEEKWPRKLRVSVQLNRLEGAVSPEYLFSQIADLLGKYQGSVPVELYITRAGEFVTCLDLDKRYSVRPAPNLVQELSRIVSVPGGVRVETFH